jgi:DNA-nicking Smr family endonuclease
MKGVRPLARTERVSPSRRLHKVETAPDDDQLVLEELAELVSGTVSLDVTHSDEHIQGLASGVSRQTLRKLRAGGFSIRAHVDLHGLTRIEARDRVEHFVADSRRRGYRCVLIVHGRGLNSEDGVPVLKEALRLWLTKGRIARAVLAFCSARPTVGGRVSVAAQVRRG